MGAGCRRGDRIYGSTIDESGALTQKQLDEIRLEAVNKTSKN